MDSAEIIRGLTELRDPEFLFALQYLGDAGIDLAADPVRAMEYLERRSQAGYPEAQLALAKLLFVGLVGARAQSAALHWCEKSVDAGYAPAYVFLASFYSEGWAGVRPDNNRALSLLQQGADAGYSHAMALLATTFLEGIRVPKDREKGMAFLIQASEHGDASSQFLLATELLMSLEAEQRQAGARWLKAASSQDLLSAHRKLAHLYQEGSPEFPRDEVKASFHRQRADNLDHSR